jgi:hypothetical protein
MNISDNERFHELAHKALAKQATPGEQRELRALIAENPKLKEELEQIGGETSVLRELLPLLEDLQQPPRGIPHLLMERLKSEVGEVIDANAESKSEIVDVLARLEKWARQQVGASRDEVMAMIAVLRESILSGGSEEPVAEAAMLRAPEIAHTEPRLREEAEAGARAEEKRNRQAELERRLVSLEARIRQAEEITHACRDEVRALLEAFLREREAGAEHRGRNPNP